MYVPELEIVRRWLIEHCVGQTVRTLHVASSRVWIDGDAPPAVDGAALRAVDRMGRHLILQLGEGALALLVRGAGALYVGGPSRAVPLHWRVALEMEGRVLWLCDQSNASRALMLVPEQAQQAESVLRKVDPQGVEPLSKAFTLGTFKKVLRGRRRSIFQLLADGQLIAGIGDGYADEILYASRVRPTRPAPSLGDEELRTVYYSIVEVLQKAIRFGGISDEQQPYIEGQPGVFQRFLAMHGRPPAPCPGCRGRIRVVALDKVSAYFCPHCQR